MSTPTPGLPEETAAAPIRATGGQIAIAVITSVLVVLFAITTLVFAGIYSLKSSDLNEAQEELSTVQQQLQEAQEAAK